MAISIAPFQTADYPELMALASASPDTGLAHFTAEHLQPPDEANRALCVDAELFVARVDGALVGAADVSYGQIQYEGEVRSAALLGSLMGSLMVHPAHRRQGVASALASHRVAAARRRLGQDAILLADIQQGNVGSQRTAAKWRTAESRPFITAASPVRPSAAPEGPFTVRAATIADLDEILVGLRAFYREANFYRPQSAETLRPWIAEMGPAPPRRYFVATERGGRVVAGLGITHLYRYLAHRVVDMPLWMQGLNLVFREIPSGGVLREADVGLVFHRGDGVAAAHQLWEAVRHGLGGQANTLLFSYDPQGPLAPLASRLRLRSGVRLQTAIFAAKSPDPARPLAPWVL